MRQQRGLTNPTPRTAACPDDLHSKQPLCCSFVIATAIQAGAESPVSTCRLLSYDGHNTTVETFRYDFIQHGGDAMVKRAECEFRFLAAEQGETYIRMNSIPLRFTRTGEYTLEVTQSPWLR